MQVHREVFIRGNAENLDAVGEEISRSLTDGWTRDADAEDYMRSDMIGGSRKVYCFASPKRPRQPAATLFLINRDPQTLYVANVVPHHTHELSREEYNNIVEDFFKQYVEPAAARNGASAEMTEPRADLVRWLTPVAAEKLRAFLRPRE